MISNSNKESPFYESIDNTDYIYNNNLIIPLYPGERFVTMIPIPGIINVRPDYYNISNYGRILSFATGRAVLISGTIDRNGYISVKLRNMRGDSESYRVHRLVMIYFNLIPNWKDMVVDHLNGDRTDNRLENLQWTDQKGNCRTASINNLNRSRFSEDEIIDIRKRIFEGESTTSVAKDYCCSKSMILMIKNCQAYSHIVTPYDQSAQPVKTLTKEQIFEIYNKSAEKVDDQKYADEYGTTRSVVKNIRLCIGHYGKIMPNNKPIHLENGNKRFNEEQALRIYESCKSTPVDKIAEIYGVDRSVIDDIKFTRKGYSYLHEKYGLDPLKNLREQISEEKAIEIHKALSKYTTRDVAKQFNVCERTVYLIKFCMGGFEYLCTKYDLMPYSKLRGGYYDA